MSEKIVLPELGDGIETADVVNLLVSKGDAVEKDSVLFELETEKAVVEFPSPQAGRIAEIHIKKGDTVKVGQLLFTLETDGEQKEPQEKEREKKPEEKSEEKKKQPEEKLEEKKEDLKEPEEAEKVLKEKETTAESVEKSESKAEPEKKPSSESANESAEDLLPAGPATRKLARELGIELSAVQGTARGGRITLDDVKSYVKQRLASAPASEKAQVAELPDFSKWGPVERKPLSSLRKKVAENLSAAWPTVPLVTQFDEADITELEKMRKKNVDYVKEKGGKLTITVFVLKAVVAALKAFPQFNASLDINKGELVYKQYFNIGVAVDTEAGLIVPVIKNVDDKSFTELAVELTELSKKARDRKVSLEELRGGNISVSNLGGIGGTGFTPLVSPPDVAVIGLSRSKWVPVWREDKVKARLIMPFSVSYDHRVVDGADGVKFSRFLAHELETFQELLLEG